LRSNYFGRVQGYVEVDLHAFNTTDLIHWSAQVASAMGHLVSKHVIHGDLSARNILLDGNRIAKICDFGLSHHLYTNATYLASPDARLPWKWMAAETLLERTLSTKSDIWSFGVTLWEIFSLGAEPYETLEWNPSFAYSLSISGCQLEQPEFANAEIFQIMKKCWEIFPERRPDFTELESQMRGIVLVNSPTVEDETEV
jgi:serine/threonine protein kinase